MWDLIVSVPDHCLSFYFSCVYINLELFSRGFRKMQRNKLENNLVTFQYV